jgi:hypothetical protein
LFSVSSLAVKEVLEKPTVKPTTPPVRQSLSRCATLFLLVLACALPNRPLAQGWVRFSNKREDPTKNWPAYQGDFKTLLSGSEFVAELLAGTNQADLKLVAQTTFLTGTNAGYFDGGVVTLSNIFPGSIVIVGSNTIPNNSAWFQVRLWNAARGSSYISAYSKMLPSSAWASTVWRGYVGDDSNSVPVLQFYGESRVVLYPPLQELEIEVSTNGLLLTWSPTWDGGPIYVLQQSPSLTQPDWTAVGVSGTGGAQFIVPKPQGAVFYRLVAE